MRSRVHGAALAAGPILALIITVVIESSRRWH
jgi:hypothetical protein